MHGQGQHKQAWKTNWVFIFLLLSFLNYTVFRYSFSGKPINPALTQISEVFRGLCVLIYLPNLTTHSRFTRQLFPQFICFFTFALGGLVASLTWAGAKSGFYAIWAFVLIYSAFASSKEQIHQASWRMIYIILSFLMLGLVNGQPFEIAFSSKVFWPAFLVILFANVASDSNRPNNRRLSLLLTVSLLFILLSGKRFALVLFASLVASEASFVLVFLVLGGLVLWVGADKLTADNFETIYRLQKLEITNGQLTEVGYSQSFADRSWIYQSYLHLWQKFPLGLGLGAASDLHSKIYADSYLAGYSPHNSFLAALIETGILGGLAYATAFVLALAQTLYRKKRILFFLVLMGQMFIEYNSSPGQILFLPILMFLALLYK